ncbi:hypothetical protein [Rhizobium anhuiense]|uniref:hypothetical protein n=1 Tax=Rhizobium anhuiense TaxID=1184720 RepID=UPI001FDEFE4C|nr:hypothetical protein [Rhizobium anhuiense]
MQDILRKDAERIGKLFAAGGQVLLCGNRDMAAAVAAVLADILAVQGFNLELHCIGVSMAPGATG